MQLIVKVKVCFDYTVPGSGGVSCAPADFYNFAGVFLSNTPGTQVFHIQGKLILAIISITVPTSFFLRESLIFGLD